MARLNSKKDKKKNDVSSDPKQNQPNKKPEKNKNRIIKNTLANPFTLDWPSINYKHYTDIKVLLTSSLSCLTEDFKKYREEKLTYRRNVKTMRRNKKVSEDNKIDTNEDQKKELHISNEKYKGLVIGHENLVFGYNAVMRGLEKGTIVSVLVNNKAKPDFIIRMFLPICALKSIPIIPIEDLSGIVKEINIGIKSCLALGLKREVITENNIFHNLYLKTCEALEFDPLSLLEVPEKINSELATQMSPTKVIKVEESSIDIGQDHIKHLHLRRSNVSERVFKPNLLKSNESVRPKGNLLGFDSDFIELESLNVCPKVTEIKVKTKKKRLKKTITDVDASQLSSTSMFTIDEVGDFEKCRENKHFTEESAISSDRVVVCATNVAIVDSSQIAISDKFRDDLVVPISCDVKSHENLATIQTQDDTVKNQTNLSSEKKRTSEHACMDVLLSRKKKKRCPEFYYIPTKVKRVNNGLSTKVKKNKKALNVGSNL